MKLIHILIFGIVGIFVFLHEEKKSINNHYKLINYKPKRKESQVWKKLYCIGTI